MQTRPIQLTDVTYNAATQCFEALVTVQDGSSCAATLVPSMPRLPCHTAMPLTACPVKRSAATPRSVV